jgi:hypothetical protein
VGKVLRSTTSACASVPGNSRVRPLTPDIPQGGNQNLVEIWPIASNGRETLGPWAGLRM